jgi:hypothetical protein
MALPLVDDWRNAGSWLTVRIGGLFAAWGALPAESQAAALAFLAIPQERLASIVGIAVVLARIYKQRKMVPAQDFAPTQRMDK